MLLLALKEEIPRILIEELGFALLTLTPATLPSNTLATGAVEPYRCPGAITVTEPVKFFYF